ncbi:class I SAM-dependent methyltransferase [Geomonas subterranea]|uniref:Class I SAM-dependent methyltransferase n=1 Tax=Geomonas subterranea TaxID=2847989 RepID=A0ABX8LL41_9BACT|nr:class I SAM-dependent methyltransferase [Geomonas subterranea]QXE92736.1 class I SAM-dependent methyltransferase [Geomonas subterranea]QXM09164.1 class I SAM-dependent methyltransferase [Geomonas subterranea]
MIRPASSVIRYAHFFRLARVRRVLDYGAGPLRNALYLSGEGFHVYAADVPERVKALAAHPQAGELAGILTVGELPQAGLSVDLVLCTFVFNILATRSHRKQYLGNVVANLRCGGYFLIEVNSRQEDCVPCGSVLQHYYSCDGTAKSYSHDELDRLLAPFGLERICHYYSSHALAAVYRLAQ